MTLEVVEPENEAVHPILVFKSNNKGIVVMIRAMVNSAVKKLMDSILGVLKVHPSSIFSREVNTNINL